MVRLIIRGLIFDLFIESGFLVAVFNSRGAGQSGGHSNASAHTQTEDYESVVERVVKQAHDANTSVSQLYICVYSSKGCLTAGIL